MQESIPELVCQLADRCQHQATHPKPKFLVWSRTEKNSMRKRIKNKVYDTIFQHLHGPHRHINDRSKEKCVGKLSYVDQLLAHCFTLRLKRKFDDANRLEHITEKLAPDGKLPDDLQPLLQFLLCLAGSGPEASDVQVLGKDRTKLPIVFPDKDSPQVLPDGPLCFGDSCLQRPQDRYYMHYPPHIFEAQGLSDFQKKEPHVILNMQIFEAPPGTGLIGNGIFNANEVALDPYERRLQTSLFGGLAHSGAYSIDVKLDFPELADDIQPDITALTLSKTTDASDDEGFVDTVSNGSTVANFTPDSSGIEEDIWDVALRTEPDKHYIWEAVGRAVHPRERPYITEAGCEVFDKLYKIYTEHLSFLDPAHKPTVPHPITMATLVTDTINLLIGVPSRTFILNEATDSFSMCGGLYVSGWTPPGLASACKELAECGTNYRRLQLFSQPPVMDSLYVSGLIFQAYTGAVRKYLQHYRGCVLSISPNTTLLQLKSVMHKVMQQIRFLCQLCKCEGKSSGKEEFPTGVALLSYLYREALDMSGSTHYPMMLSLLHTSAGPYLMFAQDWVFQGVCRDVYGEFMIQVNEDYLRYRDKHYWTHGYVMVAKEIEESTPLFLQDLSNHIYVCGKSINLLRLVAPQHFLFSIEEKVPRVAVTFSEEDLMSIEQRCEAYYGRMMEMMRQRHTIRTEKIEQAERAKHDLMVKARKMAAAELDRLQTKMTEIKRAQDVKKRQVFQELKQQMEEDLKRRKTERLKEKKVDAARVAAVTQQEIVETRAEEELEKQARDELVDYYARLTEEAAAREQKAMWRVRRGKLDLARMAFLREEEAKLLQEINEMNKIEKKQEIPEAETPQEGNTASVIVPPSGDDKSMQVALGDTRSLAKVQGEVPHPATAGDQTDGVLPHWAEKSEDKLVEVIGDSPATPPEDLPSWAQRDTGKAMLVTDSKSSALLPNWAKEGLKRPTPAFGLDHYSTEDMPMWAKKGLETVDDDPVMVHDVEYAEEGSRSHSSSASAGALMGDAASAISLKSEGKTEVLCKAHPSDASVGSLLGDRIDEEAEKTENIPETINEKVEDTAVKIDDISAAVPHVNTESEFAESRPMIRVMEGAAMKESESVAETRHTKQISGKHSSQETTQDLNTDRPHLRMSKTMQASTESVATDDKYHSQKRIVDDQHASKESSQEQQMPHMKMHATSYASKESQPQLPVIKKPSFFGHISQLSHADYNFPAPKMKKSEHKISDLSEDWFCYQIKPGHKQKRGMRTISEMQDGDDVDAPSSFRSQIHINPSQHPSLESKHVDVDRVRLQRFKKRNIYGHSSDSTAQKLLYGEGYHNTPFIIPSAANARIENIRTAEDIEMWTSCQLEIFMDKYNMLNSAPRVDLMANIVQDLTSSLGDYGISADLDTRAHQFVSLPALLERSVTAPLRAQIMLVNKCVVNYFLVEMSINTHFEALRSFLLMQDGEFGQSLSDQLFDKLASKPLPQEMFNPVFLGNVLSRALQYSMSGDGKHAANMSFTLKHFPQIINYNAADALDCLELIYKVDWPLNIIITDTCLTKYSRVFTFMLQLKRAVWVLKDVWHKLKRDCLIHNATHAQQFRQLQLFRHEMQHFVKVMQGYIANQILHVTWQEFQEQLGSKVHTLDDLHHTHADYLNTCLFRCLLNKKAGVVMKIIQDIFTLILKLRAQLVSHSWQRDPDSNEVMHPAFDNMCASYKSFQEYSKFLFKVVSKLALRGYQPHLQELLLRLNFNAYYQETS